MNLNNKKVLIVSVAAGAGHVRAAEAMKKQLESDHPDWNVSHIDMLDYISLASKKLFFDSYNLIISEIPKMWGVLYNSIDVPKRRKQFDKMTNVFKKIEKNKFTKAIENFDPDYIICTHFTPPGIIGDSYKNKMGIIVTDYYLHELWFYKPDCDYFVSTGKMAWKLKNYGVNDKNIHITTIPISSCFGEEKNVNKLKEKYNIDNNKKNILVLSGGHGLGNTPEIVSNLCLSQENLNIFAIAGKSEKLKRKLEKIKTPENIQLNPIGWTDSIDEYMRISDLIITKPGGLTVSEVIYLQKPIIAINPIPGQEERNIEYMLEKDYGKQAHTAADLLYYIQKNPTELAPGYNLIKKEQPTAAQKISQKLIKKI